MVDSGYSDRYIITIKIDSLCVLCHSLANPLSFVLTMRDLLYVAGTDTGTSWFQLHLISRLGIVKSVCTAVLGTDVRSCGIPCLIGASAAYVK